MFKWCSRIDGRVVMVMASFALVFVPGCAKKASSVRGSSGLSDASSGSQSSSNRGFGERGTGSDDVTSSQGGRSNRGLFGDEGSADSGSGRGGPGSSVMDAGLIFSDNVYFDFDQWRVRDDAEFALSDNAKWMVLNSGIKIQIEGHGDERGTNDYNLVLGERRARSIMRYLINLGVKASRFSFISYGEEKGICDDQTEACYQQNRRVHFQVRK